jgi:ParB-like nuclease domain
MAGQNGTSSIDVPVEDLDFDVENPRLAEYGVDKTTSEEEILSILWDAMDVREIVQSISASGYFSHEPLIVIKVGKRYTVIEGNRRLAAVKVLLNENLAKEHKWDAPALSKMARDKLRKLPVIVSTRKESWRYLGFKHVNGPAKWSSYAKATYIADVHRTYKVHLEDIAQQIGDRHRTVQRLYRGLMVIEQAEREKVYNREDNFRPRFAFSHLYTGLDYEGFSEFLQLRDDDPEAEDPVPKARKKELGELCLWLFGSKRLRRPPVVETQNPHLRQLDAVLRNRQAVSALRDGADISAAFELTRPPTAVFEESLLKSKRELTRARAILTTGYDGSEELLRIAGTIAELADDVYNEMDRKRNPGKKTRLTEEG